MALQDSFNALKDQVDQVAAEVADSDAKIDVVDGKIDAVIVLVNELKAGQVLQPEQLDALTTALSSAKDTLSAKTDELEAKGNTIPQS